VAITRPTPPAHSSDLRTKIVLRGCSFDRRAGACIAVSFFEGYPLTFHFDIEGYGFFAAYGAYPYLMFEVRPLVIVLAS